MAQCMKQKEILLYLNCVEKIRDESNNYSGNNKTIAIISSIGKALGWKLEKKKVRIDGK